MQRQTEKGWEAEIQIPAILMSSNMRHATTGVSKQKTRKTNEKAKKGTLRALDFELNKCGE